MMQINLSKEYHTQTNNKFVPLAACGPTVGAMGLIARGVDYWSPPDMDPADYITAELHGVEAWEKFREEHPQDFKAGLIPQNRSEMLAWGINRVAGYQADRFTRQGSLRHVVWHLTKGRPIGMSGRFTKSGHFVCVVGVFSLQHESEIDSPDDVKLELVEYFVVDDPFGNYYQNYKDQRGHGIMFDVKLFNRLTNTFKRENQKWIHPFYLPGEV